MTPASMTPDAHRFDLGTHRLAYLSWGEPDKPALVLLHGGLDFAGMWQEVAGRLASDWHVLALDLRGHGDSDWSSTGDYHSASYLADILRFVNEVAGAPARLVGHSMGARLALQLAGAVPEAVSRLVAIEGLGAEGGPPPGDTLDPKMRDWLANRAARTSGEPAAKLGAWVRARATAGRDSRVHPDLEERIERQLADRKKALTAEQARAFVTGNMRAVEGGWVWKFDPLARWQAANELIEDHRPLWQAIEARVLHLYGSESWAYPPEPNKLAAFRNARLAVVAGAGHWVHLNAPGDVAREIDVFLRSP